MARWAVFCGLLAFGAGRGEPAGTTLEPSQKAVLDRMTGYAREYEKRLPDFMCTRITHRSRANAGAEGKWKQLDTIEEEVTVTGGKENDKILKVNGKPVKPGAHRSGFNSSGEFGSHLTSIFTPDTHTAFQWERAEGSGGRPISVFRFQVSREKSGTSITQDRKKVTVGYGGLLYAADSGVVERLHIETEDPEGLSVRGITTDIRYVEVSIAGQKYWLAGQAEARIGHKGEILKREMEYRDYHKYGADAAVTFDVPK